jgi:hypothetical protein
MAVGDKSAQSYGWQKTLEKAVPSGDGVKIPAPGFDHRYTDTEHVDVNTPDGKVYRAGGDGVPGVDVTFENAGSHELPVSAIVTNNTQVEWPIGGTIYVFCPHLLAAGANEWDLKEQIYDLQERVKALEEAVLPPKVVEPEPEPDEEEEQPAHRAKSHKRRR